MKGKGQGVRGGVKFAVMLAAAAAAYFVPAVFAAMLPATPPKAVPVWPAAGVALAVVLRWPKLWPGVLIGSLASLAWNTRGIGLSPLAVGLTCVLVGMGAAAQAVAGGMLVRRWVPRYFNLDEDSSIGRFMLLAGPVAATVSATLGTLVFWGNGLIAADAIPQHWLTWYIGDAIGTLIFAPMLLIWAGEPRRSRRLSFVVVVTAAFSLVVAVFVRVNQSEQNRAAEEKRRRLEQVALVMQLRIAYVLETLNGVAEEAEISRWVDEAGFKQLVEYTLSRAPALMSITWASHAGDGASMRPEVIRRGDGSGDDLTDVEQISHALREAAVSQAEKAGESLALPTDRPGVALLVAPGRSPRAAVVLATLDIERLMARSPHVEVVVALLLKPLGGAPVQVFGSREPQTQAVEFEVGRATWELRAGPTGTLRIEQGWAWTVLAAGLLFLVLLEAFLLLVTGRASRVESLVAQRTRELEDSRRAVEEQRGELERSNQELATALGAKEVLLKELHHRVKNNLQVISSLFSLQARYLSDPRYRAIFEESRNRVFSIALAHEKLYRSKDLARIDFSEYARNLIDHLHSMLGNTNQAIEVKTEIGDATLPVETAIPCGLLINELVTNAFKHAFPDGRAGTIRVVLQHEEPGRWLVAVEDDGIGLPADVHLGETDSLGLDLVSILATQIGAQVQIERHQGTRFRLSFGRERRPDA